MTSFGRPAWYAMVAWLVGCGGSEFSSDAEDGGAGAAGGSGGSGTAGSPAGTSSSGAPSAGTSSAGTSSGGDGGSAAVEDCSSVACGAPCRADGLRCETPDPCCPVPAICDGDSWQCGDVACAEPACPPDPPLNATSCECLAGRECSYDACATATIRVRATCDGGGWATISESCPAPPYCDAVSCLPGEVCVKAHLPTGGETYACRPDPCWPAPLECGCAVAACPDAHVCSLVFGERSVLCDPA